MNLISIDENNRNYLSKNMIEKLISKNKEYKYQIPEYLYSYLFRFAIKNGIDIWTNNTLKIEDFQVGEIVKLLEIALKDLLDEFYEEPIQRKISKYSGRYIRLVLSDTEYTINNTIEPGRTMYGINNIIIWFGNTDD